MPDESKPTLKMDGKTPVITVPLTCIAKGMNIEVHQAAWESHGLRVNLTVHAKRIKADETKQR